MLRETLIIDDDKILCKLHEKVCMNSGLPQPRVFYGALPALTYIKENNLAKNRFLILLDLNMPGTDGWEFLSLLEMETLYASLVTVIVTSSIDPKDRDRAGQIPLVHSFVTKPFVTEKGHEIRRSEIFRRCMET